MPTTTRAGRAAAAARPARPQAHWNRLLRASPSAARMQARLLHMLATRAAPAAQSAAWT